MLENRPNIGFFTCHLDNDYAYEVLKGVEYAAREADANLIIFPGMYLDATYNDPKNAKYDYQYNSIFYYASHKTLDALIVSIGSIGSFISTEDKKTFLSSFDVPILTIEVEVPGYPYLYTEGTTGMHEAIEHLIKEHKKTNIGYVGGREENADARERLEVYRTVLAENNIPVDDSKIVYGNFSEYSEEVVSELLDRHPDLEAIVFANDQMTIGGYRVLKSRGYKIGKDILVTGFDNSITSLVQDPPLTTVENNIMDLGYNALYQAISLVKTGKTTKSLLHSNLIRRNSCGCSPASDSNSIQALNGQLSEITPEKLLDYFKEKFMNHYFNSFYAEQMFQTLDPFFLHFIYPIFDDSKTPSRQQIQDEINEIFNSELINYFSNEQFSYTLNLLSEFLLNLDIQPEKTLQLSKLFSAALSYLSCTLSSELHNTIRQHKTDTWSSVYITRDTLLTSNDETQCFQLIMEKLLNSGFKSAYIYLYDQPVKQYPNGRWEIPDNVLFQACNKDGEISVFHAEDRIIPSSMVFHNKYTNNDIRHTMVVTPIFTNEVQHGLFVCEADIHTFGNIYAAALQLGTSLKFISLMKQQFAIQNRLESTMSEINEKNDLLNHLYITDELTQLYNRRGFFEVTQRYINLKSNAGKTGIITFADMDNLKQVNDKFGHKEGDFALKQIAETLRKSFSDDAIIARLGGDEFVAFTLINSTDMKNKITGALSEYTNNVNATCGKPYYIDLSYGITEFTCSETLNIEDILIQADEILYQNKRYKRKSVLK